MSKQTRAAFLTPPGTLPRLIHPARQVSGGITANPVLLLHLPVFMLSYLRMFYQFTKNHLDT